MAIGRVVSINRSRGGVPKRAVPEARATVHGIEGDAQQDRRNHGGPDRAVSLYSLELIEQLRREGHPIEPGAVGENLTLAGIDWRDMQPGRHVIVGEVELELTSYAAPCKTIRGAFHDDDSTRISHKVHPGWSRLYARVVSEGTLRMGDPVSLATPSASTVFL
jgi:MOSC domain-containing protein YiiM